MSEDKAIQKQLFSKKYRMMNQKSATVYHGHMYNLHSLIKRCENEGLGWRFAGVRYSFTQMFRDLMQEQWVYGALIRGLLNREVNSAGELLFLLIRPLCVFKGNMFNSKYRY